MSRDRTKLIGGYRVERRQLDPLDVTAATSSAMNGAAIPPWSSSER